MGEGKEKNIRWDFTQPGCPAQNDYIERFNGTYRSSPQSGATGKWRLSRKEGFMRKSKFKLQTQSRIAEILKEAETGVSVSLSPVV